MVGVNGTVSERPRGLGLGLSPGLTDFLHRSERERGYSTRTPPSIDPALLHDQTSVKIPRKPTVLHLENRPVGKLVTQCIEFIPRHAKLLGECLDRKLRVAPVIVFNQSNRFGSINVLIPNVPRSFVSRPAVSELAILEVVMKANI
jgi:hypothetical protein